MIEILVVMAIVATLLSVVAPRYFASMQRAREDLLRHDLEMLREAIDKYHSDRLRYPTRLDELAELHYLRTIPPDPMASGQSWRLQWVDQEGGPAIADVHSQAPGIGRDGAAYESW